MVIRSVLCRTGIALVPLFMAGTVLSYAQAPDILIRGGWLFDGTGDTVVHNPGILIRAGKIIEVGDTRDEVAGEPIVLELNDGQTISPGMFDLHAHYAMDLLGRGRVDETRAYPTLFLANGVTSTYPCGEIDPHEMMKLRVEIDSGKRIGPRVYNSGPYFGRARSGWKSQTTREQIHREVDEWAARGVRCFKAKGITAEHLAALVERAHQHGIPVTGHLGSGYKDTVNPRDAIRMGIDRVEHFLGGDALTSDRSAYSSLENLEGTANELDAIMALYVTHNVHFDATLTAYGYFGKRDPEVYDYFMDEQQYLTPYTRELLSEREKRKISGQFEKIYWVKRRTIKAFYDAGGGHLITLGTDHPSWGEYLTPFCVHRELHAMVLAGIPPADVLKVATINGARALNVANTLGTVEPGKLADLVVVEGNPLRDIRNTRNVELVIKAGRIYDPEELLASVRGTIGPTGPDDISDWAQPGR